MKIMRSDNFGWETWDPLVNLLPVQAGHFPVAQSQVVSGLTQALQGGFLHREPNRPHNRGPERFTNHLQNHFFVIDDEHFLALSFAAVFPRRSAARALPGPRVRMRVPNGNSMRKDAPSPGLLRTEIVPPCS